MTTLLESNAAVIWPQIAGIVTALGTILLGYFTYNQYAKNKKTDAKLEQMKKDADTKSDIRNEKMAKIYGILWRILYETKADRVYIAQPHPLTNALYLSVGIEVKRKGLAKNAIEDTLSLSEIANFASELSKREFLFYADVVKDVRDNRQRLCFTVTARNRQSYVDCTTMRTGWVVCLWSLCINATTWFPQR